MSQYQVQREQRILLEYDMGAGSEATDSIHCPVDVALPEFDRLYAKLLADHADRPDARITFRVGNQGAIRIS